MPTGETKRAFAEDGARKTHIGGQALIEGVMMRGKYNWAVGVREPNGHLHAEEHPLSKHGNRPAWMSWPLVRGCVALVDSLVLGYKALEIAANHALAEDEEPAESVNTAATVAPTMGQGASTAAEGEEAALRHPERARREASPLGRRVEGSPCRSVQCEPDGEEERPFSWKDDFGRPDPILEALGVQTKLEVVHEPVAEPAEPAMGPVGSADAIETTLPASGPGASVAAKSDSDEFGKGEMAFAMVLGIVLGVALFILLPAFASNLLVGEYEQQPLAWNLVDGVMRVAIFIFYVWLIGRMKDIYRMFCYHGAEHKTIHCYEHGLPLTPENARQFPRLHVRCGTAFLIMVMIVAILVYTVVPLDAAIAALGIDGAAAFALLIVVRIVLMPVIAGISYEITVRWAGSHPENRLVRVVLWPGMQMQRLTTHEPDDGMLECAIAAMQLVLEREEREAAAG